MMKPALPLAALCAAALLAGCAKHEPDLCLIPKPMVVVNCDDDNDQRVIQYTPKVTAVFEDATESQDGD